MTDEWYVLFGGKIRGPATASQLRSALAAGKIQPETPVRAGTDGAWTFIRELPDLGDVSQTLPLSGKDSVVLDRADLTQTQISRGVYYRLILGGAIALAALGGGVFATIRFIRPSDSKSAAPAAIDAAATSLRSETSAIKNVPVNPPANVPVAKVAATAQVATIAEPAALPIADPAPPIEKPIKPAKKTVRVAPAPAPVSAQIASADGGGSSPTPTSRDHLDIPWPNPQADTASDDLDWEKLDNTIREHNKLYEQWKRQRNKYQELSIHLMKVANHLEDLQRRATAVGRTMSRIQGFLGDANTENAPVFAPPETPRWVQSLAKNYTLRMGDMSRLDSKATRAVNDFNGTLVRLDSNLAIQKKTLTRATELRSEWVRITRPFGLWTRQDRRIPLETSTRWILNNAVFAPAYVARCVAEIREKSFEKAGQDIETAIKKDPSWADLYALQAVLQDRAGKRVDADKSFKTARRLAKKSPSSFIDVCDGIVCSNRRNYEGARTRFGAAAKHDPANPAGQAELALLLVTFPKTEKHDAGSAVEAATAACQATAWSHWWCLDVLALAYAANGDFDRAVGCVHRAKQAAPADVQPFLDERIASYKKKQVPTATVGDL